MARFFKPQKKKALDTQHKSLTVTRLDHHGDGIGFLDKRPVFVPGVLPGEEALVQLVEQKKNYARARLIKRLSDSPERVKPVCPHYAECGGCNLQHCDHDAQVSHKQAVLADLMNKLAGASATQDAPLTSSPLGYRRRARLSLRVGKDGALQMGFRRRGADNIVDVEVCPVMSQPLQALLEPLRKLFGSLRGRRVLGHAELAEGAYGVVLLVRTTKALVVDDVVSLTGFAENAGITLYIHQGNDAPVRVSGNQPAYNLGELSLAFEPTDFIQVNGSVNEKMVAQALAWLDVQPDDRVLDLFSGVGNFSLPLAEIASAVVGVEGVDEMVERAAANARRNRQENVAFYQANLEELPHSAPWTKEKFTKVLLDPARAGAAGAMEFVAQLRPERIVYVSCNPATLSRDSQQLLSAGYKLEKLGMLDMFPHTGHLESMALFVKS
ncbi:23S rRNA (uracil(1939)-C(5))-methyltransferase RlmD [Parasalinivibrio latis]|uniref:23S rRNA (uracil(1939)-C(5))-methyltransferase RlmD n=1 Tax=Parasalinivibrio latis TaxID=2952610 RepID=UPI0030E413CD